jgi:hypothetical protein
MTDPTIAAIAAKLIKGCKTCAFDMGQAWIVCAFPDPQDGTDPPFMASASMPDQRNGGANCHHYRRAVLAHMDGGKV